MKQKHQEHLWCRKEFEDKTSATVPLVHGCVWHINDWKDLLADLTAFTASAAMCMTIWVNLDKCLVPIG